MILENPIKMVTEGEDPTVDVCLTIVSPNITCPIAFSFELFIATEDVEAGKFQIYIITYLSMLLLMSPSQCLLVTTLVL